MGSPDELCIGVEFLVVRVLAGIAKQRSCSDEDENASEDERKPKRHRVTKHELDILEKAFLATGGYPDSAAFERLAHELNWGVMKVKKWFQNQRQRQKERKQMKVDDETLSMPPPPPPTLPISSSSSSPSPSPSPLPTPMALEPTVQVRFLLR
jgi:hypothetical protein